MEKIFKQSLETFSDGSHVAFKKMERPEYSETERELDFENKRRIQECIRILRKMRTSALETPDIELQQKFLKEAHELSEQAAEIVINLASLESPIPIEEEFKAKLVQLRKELEEQDAGSGYSLPPQYSVQNLFKATEDILVRIKERATSFEIPDHKLEFEELKYVLHEFLKGTNDLNNEAIEVMFASSSKIGGILSGGAIYAEIVKKIIEKYADTSFKIDTFVIAVDRHDKKAVYEQSATDAEIVNVILVDDVINEGGTMSTALWSAGEHFPKARIRSGKGTDCAGEWYERKEEKHMNHLGLFFQDFADLAEEGKHVEAMAIYARADAYANEHGIKLPGGWNKRKEKIEAKSKTEFK